MALGQLPAMLVGALRRVDAAILFVVRWSIIVLLAVMVVTVFMQVTSRYLFETPLLWSEEVARLAFICLVFLGAANLAREDGHIAVTALVDALPSRVQHLLAAVAGGVGMSCSSYLVQGAWRALHREWHQRAPATDLPMGIVYSVIFASLVMMFGWLLVSTLRALSRAVTAEPIK